MWIEFYRVNKFLNRVAFVKIPQGEPKHVLESFGGSKHGDATRSHRVTERVYSGAGTGANITWTLQSDVRFVYHGWNLMAESNRGTEVRKPVLRQHDCPAGVRTRAERPKQIEMLPTAADAPRRTLVQAQIPYLRRSYMWGPDMSGTLDGAGGVGGLLAMRRHERGTQSTETFWATHDLNGNVIGLVQLPVTGSQPAKMAVYDYDPSGQLTRVNEPEAGGRWSHGGGSDPMTHIDAGIHNSTLLSHDGSSIAHLFGIASWEESWELGREVQGEYEQMGGEE